MRLINVDLRRPKTCDGGASDPALVSLSHEKLRRFHPGLYGLRGLLRAIADYFRWGVFGYWRIAIEEHLYHGDSRAALVMSLSPLLVAAYSDELDCVALLKFPEELVTDYPLAVGSRLLTANTYYYRRAMPFLQDDLTEGPRSLRNFTGIEPLIAEFLSDDMERIEQRKRQIDEEEWSRARELGQAYLAQKGTRARDGRPLRCGRSS